MEITKEIKDRLNKVYFGKEAIESLISELMGDSDYLITSIEWLRNNNHPISQAPLLSSFAQIRADEVGIDIDEYKQDSGILFSKYPSQLLEEVYQKDIK